MRPSAVDHDTSDFPQDRSIDQNFSERDAISIAIAPEHAHFGNRSDLEAVSFAALLVFSRMLGQEAVEASVGAGSSGRAGLFARAEFRSGTTLAQAFRGLKLGSAASGTARIDLAILARTESSCGVANKLFYEREPSGLRLWLDVETARVSRITAQDYLEKLALVLEALAERPDLPCSDVILLTASARRIIPDLSRPISASAHEFVPATFLRVARDYATRPAVVGHEGAYSYDDLSRAVGRITGQLAGAGLQLGEVVAISGASSFGMLASMLGVLVAGGVLVTLDDALPQERQKLISEISAPRLHIFVRPGDETAPTPDAAIRVTDWPTRRELDRLPDNPLVVADLAGDASAYVFFTSGSTGVPKGVLGTHIGLAHFLEWQRINFPIGPGDHTPQLTALSFDVVLRDILYPLTSGACIHIPRRELLFDARRMLAWIQDSAITAMHCVPSLMKAWLQAHGQGKPFESLRYIFFAGEPLTDTLLKRFSEAAGPSTLVINLYGPTETTLAKLCHRVERVEPGVQPVGAPQPGVDVMIVRERRIPCGLWETGEIAIRTPYRSKGYLHNSELTRQSFAPNPYRNDATDQIYFTGDLGRYRSDGVVEIFGRIDSQIKIRGVRIEPNEIESEMLKVPGVKDAVVTARAGTNGEKFLFGVVVSDGSCSSPNGVGLAPTVRNALKDKFSAPMVPSRVLVLNELPYLPNGKLDRKAIAALQLDVEPEKTLRPNATRDLDPRMRKLVEGVEDALDISVDNLDKSFLDLGGDSLSYIQVSMVIEDILGWLPRDWEKLPLSSFAQFWETAATQKATTSLRLETAVLFRAISILLVALSHTGISLVAAATPTLFVISGMNFNRFLRPPISKSGDITPTLKMILKFGIPAGLWEGLRAFTMHKLWIPDLLLLGTFFQSPTHPHFTLWFLDVLGANLLLLSLLYKVVYLVQKAGGRAQDRNTFWSDFVWVFAGLGIAFLQVRSGWWNGDVGVSSVAPFKWFWMLAFGVWMSQAGTTGRKSAVTAVLAALALEDRFGGPIAQSVFVQTDAFFFASMTLLIWVECVPVPRWLQRPILVIASSTLFIYIVNYSVINNLMPMLGLPASWPLQVGLTVLVGIVTKAVWDQMVLRIVDAARIYLGRGPLAKFPFAACGGLGGVDGPDRTS